MKQLFFLLLFLCTYFISPGQENQTNEFSATQFGEQLQKLLCGAKNNFSDYIGKMVTGHGDTTWKTTLNLSGFNNANFSKGKSMIDYAFVAYQPFNNAEDASRYYDQVKTAINALPGDDCVKMEQARIPVQVHGVEKYDLWKSKKNIAYNNMSNIVLYVSLNLDRDNEVVINVFLKEGLK